MTPSTDQDKEHVIRQLVDRITVLESRSYNDDEQHYVDDTQRFFNQPHVLSAIILVISAMLYLTWTQSGSSTISENTKTGIFASIFFFLITGMLTFPTSGPFSKPLPILWRCVFACSIIYECFLLIILFQTKADARFLMTYLDPTTGSELVERSYADACGFTWENIAPNVFDRFALAHFLGWFVKSMIIRDVKLCWIISIGWEFLEIVFTPLLPNFAECWWDQWLLDVLICNGLGIFCGSLVQKHFKMMHHNWFEVYSTPTYTEKSKKLLKQYNLSHLINTSTQDGTTTTHKWGFTRSLKRFFGIQFIVLVFQLQELNAFFLKQLLWLPPESYLNPARLFLWMMFSLPCVRQFYLYMTNPHVKTLGRQAFLCIVIIATELMIIFKFSKDEFTAPYPEHLKQLVAILLSVYIFFNIYSIYNMWYAQPKHDVHRGAIKSLEGKLAETEHNMELNVFDVMDNIDDDDHQHNPNPHSHIKTPHKKKKLIDDEDDHIDAVHTTPRKQPPSPRDDPYSPYSTQSTSTSMVNTKNLFVKKTNSINNTNPTEFFSNIAATESEEHRSYRLMLKQKRAMENGINIDKQRDSSPKRQFARRPIQPANDVQPPTYSNGQIIDHSDDDNEVRSTTKRATRSNTPKRRK